MQCYGEAIWASKADFRTEATLLWKDAEVLWRIDPELYAAI